jgi:MFS family permease
LLATPSTKPWRALLATPRDRKIKAVSGSAGGVTSNAPPAPDNLPRRLFFIVRRSSDRSPAAPARALVLSAIRLGDASAAERNNSSGRPLTNSLKLAGSAHQAWSASLYSTASDMFPKHTVASLTGLGSAAGSTGGIIFPIFCGFLLDKFTATGNVTGGYAVLFVIRAFAYLVAFALNHLCAPRFDEISAPEFNR